MPQRCSATLKLCGAIPKPFGIMPQRGGVMPKPFSVTPKRGGVLPKR
jgi:hypothetical protein